MNRSLIVVIPAFIGFVFLSFIESNPSMELTEAIRQKKINVEVFSLGGHSGKCIQLKVKNLSNSPIQLTIKPGTTFIPENEEEQTILVASPQMIALNSLESNNYDVSGYCTEMGDHCPSTDSRFAIGMTENKSLSELVSFISPFKNLDDDLLQQAVWCITDSSSISNVFALDPVTTKSLREFLCSKTGQKDTWYQTRRNIEMDANRNIRNSATEVTGKIQFKNLKPAELVGVIKDESGKVVLKYPKNFSMPSGNISFDFRLKVSGWEKGNYFVVYTCEGKELINQKFTI